ncbi:MAG: penicillin-insensitive murein endopeptidase [Gammaproteobacteria bacterium]
MLRRFSIALLVLVGAMGPESHADSTCFGTTSAGRLEQACNLPASGDNFTAYSSLLRMAGRTHVHCSVRSVLLDAYAALAKKRPDTKFVYGETGHKNGGPFEPHKTHQNGLSVDFMVPVLNEHGASVPLPTSVLNKFGYDIEFSETAQYKNLKLDFEAISDHIAALKTAAQHHGVGIWRVILAPELQGYLHTTASWALISDLKFSEKRSWVRHDEHYHIDFLIPCEEME